ncbi:Aminopeptidase [Streptococcus cristatus]|nr:Aminopeptidase [Streptococcus cristatus]
MKYEGGWDKSPSLIFSLDCRARRSSRALLNCAEVERRNRILTNYRFLSHSLFYFLLKNY